MAKESPFDQMVKEELISVRSKNRPFNSWHEAYGILMEEVHEFQEEVFKKSSKRDRANMIKELVQIAGICRRAAEDLGLVEKE